MTRSGQKRGAAAAAAATAPSTDEAAAGKNATKRIKADGAAAPAEEKAPPAVAAPPDAAAAAAAAGGLGSAPSPPAATADVKQAPPAAAAARAPRATRQAAASSATSASAAQSLQQLQQSNEHWANNFDHCLFELLAHKVETGNYHVPKDHELHPWMLFLKREFKQHCQQGGGQSGQSLLTDRQVKVLEFLHVPLTSRGDEHWNRFYELLQQYKERHGHVLVPRLCEVPGLGDWVTDQRRQHKAWKQGQVSQLSQERREKLERLGFAWQVRNRPEWELRFQELLEFKEKHGDCKVPQHYKENKALGKWVAKQREQYKLLKKGKHSFLTPYRLEKLNQVGFSWQIRTALDGEEPDEAVERAGEGDGEGDGSGAASEAMAAALSASGVNLLLTQPPADNAAAPAIKEEDGPHPGATGNTADTAAPQASATAEATAPGDGAPTQTDGPHVARVVDV